MNKLLTAPLPVQPAGLPKALRHQPFLTAARELRPGDVCPHCQEQRLDYDGMLNLACPKCGIISGGCFT